MYAIQSITFHPVVVTAATEHRAARRALTWPGLTVVRAADVKAGDLIISGFQPANPGRLPRTDYFAYGPYAANPQPYDPTCGCGVCGLDEVKSLNGTVVLTNGFPWESCDPWPADDLVLIFPFRGQLLTFDQLVDHMQGRPVGPLDFASAASIENYLDHGWYLTVQETARL
ncbi:hypothetical protein [Kitasatospora sp. NPDC090091]|uniref:hypothetical protein n=1 Tax=Kitasatospora sp. NPDC090091 TaxID=3364081 RepID=UPI003804A5BF